MQKGPEAFARYAFMTELPYRRIAPDIAPRGIRTLS